MQIDILYKDSHIVVINKPRGMISQDSDKLCVPNVLKQQLDTDKIYTVHRLDVDTTGVMVYALNERRRRKLSQDIQNGLLKKQYIAMLDGELEKPAGRLEDLLFYDRAKQKSYIVKRQRNGVKKRVLEYLVMNAENGRTVVKIDLFTGRTHQIRAQFANIKAPVLGDARYGSKERTFIHLHCHRIEFMYHGEQMVFTTEPDWI